MPPPVHMYLAEAFGGKWDILEGRGAGMPPRRSTCILAEAFLYFWGGNGTILELKLIPSVSEREKSEKETRLRVLEQYSETYRIAPGTGKGRPVPGRDTPFRVSSFERN